MDLLLIYLKFDLFILFYFLSAHSNNNNYVEHKHHTYYMCDGILCDGMVYSMVSFFIFYYLYL